LAPITPETFFAEYWNRRPLLIQGSAAKAAQLLPGGFGRADFFSAAERAAEIKGKLGFLSAGKLDQMYAPDEGSVLLGRLSTDRMEAAAAQGYTLLSTALHDVRLARLAAVVKTQLGYAGEVLCAVSLAPNGNWFHAHTDASDNFFIQANGTKRIIISPAPVQTYARDTTTIYADGSARYNRIEMEPWEEIEPVDTSRFIEVNLAPGDVLYFPAGTVHATQATCDDSITIILGYGARNFLAVINPVLESMLMSDPNWRHVPALGLTEAGKLPTAMRDFFAARLDELRAALDAITPDELALNVELHKLLANPGDDTLAMLDVAPSAEINVPPVQPKETLRLSRRAPISLAAGVDADGDPSVTICFANREATVAAEWTPFLLCLAEQTEFVAETATTWAANGDRYDWETTREYLEALIGQGIVERVV
jgi:hypothetical protein